MICIVSMAALSNMVWLMFWDIGEYDSKLATEREQRQQVLEEHDQKMKALQGVSSFNKVLKRHTDSLFSLDR